MFLWFPRHEDIFPVIDKSGISKFYLFQQIGTFNASIED